MAKTQEEKYDTIERYATSLFYASQPEPTPRNYHAYGQFPGISGPINGAPRPVRQVQPASPVERQQAARYDRVAFSCEVNEMRNGSVSENDAFGRPASNGNCGGKIVDRRPRSASGPVYSSDLLSSLDTLLNG